MQDHSSEDRVNPVKVNNYKANINRWTNSTFYSYSSLFLLLVQGAIIFSNVVTTVSPTYAQEVRTPEVKDFVGIFSMIIK